MKNIKSSDENPFRSVFRPQKRLTLIALIITNENEELIRVLMYGLFVMKEHLDNSYLLDTYREGRPPLSWPERVI